MSKARINFSKHNLSIEVPAGTDLLSLQTRNPEAPVQFGCCQGRCGKCLLNITEGSEALTKVTPQEKLTLERLQVSEHTHRLACQCALNGSITVS